MASKSPSRERLIIPNLISPPSAPPTSGIPNMGQIQQSQTPPRPIEPDFSRTLSPTKRPRRAISTSTMGTSEHSCVFSDIECPSTPATLASDADDPSPDGGVAILGSDNVNTRTTMFSDHTETCGAGTRFDNLASHLDATVVPASVSGIGSIQSESYEKMAQAVVALSEFQQAFEATGAGEDIKADSSKTLGNADGDVLPLATQNQVSAALVEVPIPISVPVLILRLLVCCLLSLVLSLAIVATLNYTISDEVPTKLNDGGATAFVERLLATRLALTQIIGNLDTALALTIWILLCALHTLAKALVAQPCVERKVLPLHINGILVDAWPDSAGVNAISEATANALNLKIDTEKVRYIRTGLGNFHLTCGEAKAGVAFAGYSQTQEITFDVLAYWIPGLPEVTVGERFLDENGLFNTQDDRYATRPCTLCLYLVLLMATTMRQRLRFLPVLINLSGCREEVEALLDSGSTWDGMSLEYAAHNLPLGAWRYHWAKHVKCPDGTTVRTRWSVDTTIEVAGQSINRTFYIVPRLTRNIVLGHSFWYTYNPMEAFAHLVRAIEDQDSKAHGHLTMIQVGPGNGWVLNLFRKIGSFGKVQVTTDSAKLRLEIDKMDAAEMNAKRIDENQLNRLTGNEPGRTTEIKNTAKIRHLKFVTDRRKMFDAMKAAEAREQGGLAPSRSTQPTSVVPTPQNDSETNSGIVSQVLAATSHPQSTVESSLASPRPISPNPVGSLVTGNEHAILRECSLPGDSSLAQASSSDWQDHHRQGLPSHRLVLQHIATSPSSSAPTSVRSQKRPCSSGQTAANTALSHVPTCDSQESYHTAVAYVPHTPGFASSDPSLSQTNLASGPLSIPTTLTEGIAIQTRPPLGQSPETLPAADEHSTPTQPDSGPPSMMSNGESPEDEQTPAIGQSSQSLPLLTDKHVMHGVDDIAISVVDSETSV